MKLLIVSMFLVLSSAYSAGRSMQGPPFPWHDWYMIAYGGPGNWHSREFDIYIQNVSTVNQTIKVICEFKNLEMSIGNWASPTYYMTVAPEMESGTNLGGNKWEKSSIVLAPNQIEKIICKLAYSTTAAMGTNFRDSHRKGILASTIEVSEDRGAIVAYVNSRTENTGSPIQNNGAVVEAMLRNISKTFFYNGGRPF